MRGLALVVAVGVAFGAAGCGDDEEQSAGSSGEVAKASAPPKDIVAQIPGRPSLGEAQARGTYVGEAGSRRDLSVAFVVQGRQVVVYVCDGKKRGDWFAGPVDGGRFDIEADGGTRISGTVDARRIAGDLTLEAGTNLGYVAFAVNRRPGTGLYVFDDPSAKGYKARWIVSQRSVRGVSTTLTGTTKTTVSVDTRFSGVNQEVSKLLAESKALAAELEAAKSENVSLRDTLGSSQTGTSTTSTTK